MSQAFDAGEIREDFARIAALGLDAVRFFVRWDEVQPAAGRVDATILDRVARIVALAGDAGLRALPALCGRIGEQTFMPSWTASLRDLYRGPLLDAQAQIAAAVGERLRGATNVVAWDLGHAFTRVRAPRGGSISTGDHGSAPAAEPDVAAWGRLLAKTLRDAALGVTAGAYDGDLIADTHVRFGSLCAPFAFASMQGSSVTVPFARNRLDPEAVPFLAMLTAAFSFKPVLVTAVGNPTCPPGKFSPYERFALPDEPPPWTVAPEDPVFATYPCASEAENAAYATAVLERLHADGRLGAYWWCWADAPDDDSPAGSYGIIRRDGSEKPVAAALASFAREARTVVATNDMPMISSTYYYRTLPVSARTLYDAFLGAIESRRGGEK
jgi:hypothetical protein